MPKIRISYIWSNIKITMFKYLIKYNTNSQSIVSYIVHLVQLQVKRENISYSKDSLR